MVNKSNKFMQKDISIDYFNDFSLSLNNVQSIHIYEVSKNLHDLGFNVSLLLPKSNTKIKTNYKIIEIRTPKLLRSFFYQIYVLPVAVSKWRKKKPDLIYMRAGPYLFVPAILSKVYRVPMIAEVNGALAREQRSSNFIIDKAISQLGIIKHIEKIVYDCAQYIVTPTEDIRNYIIDLYNTSPNKVKLIENGVDSKKFIPKDSYSIKSTMTLGYVGSLYKWHGLQYVIEAMVNVLKEYPLAKLIIYGDGDYINELRSLAAKLDLEDNVIMNGLVPNDKVPDILRQFDVCVAYYTKDRDGLASPFKVYEYLSAGKAVIVSDIKGVGDKFHGITKVVKPEDPLELSKAIINLFDNGAERKLLGKKGRDYVTNGHTWKDVSVRIASLIKQIKHE